MFYPSTCFHNISLQFVDVFRTVRSEKLLAKRLCFFFSDYTMRNIFMHLLLVCLTETFSISSVYIFAMVCPHYTSFMAFIRPRHTSVCVHYSFLLVYSASQTTSLPRKKSSMLQRSHFVHVSRQENKNGELVCCQNRMLLTSSSYCVSSIAYVISVSVCALRASFFDSMTLLLCLRVGL